MRSGLDDIGADDLAVVGGVEIVMDIGACLGVVAQGGGGHAAFGNLLLPIDQSSVRPS